MRCAIYARHSTDMQNPRSSDDQIRQCWEYIELQGFIVTEQHIYKNEAITGTDDLRTEYRKMKKAAESKEFDCVVIDDLTRLGRHAREMFGVFEKFMFDNIRVIAVSDGLDTNSKSAEALYLLKGAISQIFLIDLRERVIRGQASQIKNGYNAGGRLFGYKYTNVYDPSGAKDDKGNDKRIGVKIEIDQEQKEVVRKIFEMKARGYGLKAIAHYLNDNGYMPPHGNGRNPSPRGWSTGSIRDILRHTKYIGDWSWGKTKWVKHPDTGKRIPIPQPESAWVKCQRDDLQIIKQSLWDKVQEELKKSGNVLRKSKGHFNGSVTNRGPAKYLFSGLLKCGKCGGSMIITNSGSYSAYVCNNCLNRGKSICDNNRRILRKTVERDLLGGIQKRVLEPKTLARLVEKVNKKFADYLKTQPSRNKGLKGRVGQLEKEIDSLSKFVLKGDYFEKIRQMLIEREAELAKCKEKLATCPKRIAEATPAIDMAWVSSKIDDLRDLFSRHQNKMELVREELRALLGGKIKLIPLPAGGKWAYEAEATLVVPEKVGYAAVG